MTQIEEAKRQKPTLSIFRYFVSFFAIIGFLTFSSIVSAVFLLFGKAAPSPVEGPVVLRLDFTSSLTQGGGFSPLDLFSENMTVQEVVDALNKASTDPRVKAVIGNFNDPRMTFSQAQEIKQALDKIPENIPTFAYSSGFGGFASANADYYLASHFEEIWMQPMGTIGLLGFGIEQPYLRSALDKIGIQPEFMARKEYKSAYSFMTQDQATRAESNMMHELLEDLNKQLIDGISKARNIPAPDLEELISKAPILAPQAASKKLVDKIAYRDEASIYLEEKLSSDITTLGVLDYLYETVDEPPLPSTPIVAQIEASGLISNASQDGTGLGEPVITATQTFDAFKSALEDPKVRGIIFRINSPGGTPNAAETIRRGLLMAKERNIPVIVSVGEIAASGGYWVAMDATKIVAMPASLTGSIGVVAGKVSAKKLMQNLDINWQKFGGLANANFFSVVSPFSDQQTKQLNQMLDHVYHYFVSAAAKGRDMEYEQMDQLARGRVYTGAQALAVGLIDELGGMDTAINLMKQELKLTPQQDIYLMPFPPPKSMFEELVSWLSKSQETVPLAVSAVTVMSKLSPLVNAVSTPNGPRVISPVTGDMLQ